MNKLIGNIFLVFIALRLFILLVPINLTIVLCNVPREYFFTYLSGYFLHSAIGIDKYANYEFKSLWRATLVIKGTDYYDFGDINETISFVLGMNKKMGTLSETGILLCKILNFIDENHVEKAIGEVNKIS